MKTTLAFVAASVLAVAAPVLEQATNSSKRAEFAGEQVQREIAVNRLTAKPAGELMQHEPGGDVGGVVRRTSGTASRFGFGLIEERRGVMVAVRRVG